MVTTRTTTDDDLIGDICAPEGSPPWCIAMKFEIKKLLHDREFNHELLVSCLNSFREYEGWKNLTNKKGDRFLFYEDFCATRPPFGLGYSTDDIDQIIAERKERDRQKRTAELAKANKEPLAEHGGERAAGQVNDQGYKNEECNLDRPAPTSDDKRGNAATYRIRKLRRDHPEIAQRLEAGEFKNVAAAERAARGIEAHPARRVATALDQLRRWWSKASASEREAFLAEVTPSPERNPA